MATEAITPNTPTKRTGPTPRALSPEQEAEVSTALQSADPPSYRQLAQQHNVSLSVIQRIAKETLANRAEDADETTELERLIGQRLPTDKLVTALAKLINDPDTPPTVRLSAINAAIEQRGIVTRKQRKDAEGNQAPGPIFVIQAGALAVQAAPVSPDKSST
jgi:hypothetical protein